MANRLSKILTRTGDKGSTGLGDGQRLAKNHPRIHCLGEIDELNACIGLVGSHLQEDVEITSLLTKIQHDLFDLGAEISQPGKLLLTVKHVEFLESEIDRLAEPLPALKEFILPAGSVLVTTIHLARTVCRRVERSLVGLHQQETLNSHSLVYLNRLSDLFFLLARFMGKRNGQAEVYWQSQYSRIKPS